MKRSAPKGYLKKFTPQNFQLQKGLEPLVAYQRMKRRATRDFRGYNYNPKTGKGQLI